MYNLRCDRNHERVKTESKQALHLAFIFGRSRKNQQQKNNRQIRNIF